jgi:Fe2+ transport system protein FeoA
MKPLSRLKKGEQAFIIGTNSDDSCIRLVEIGCFPGSLVELHGFDAKKSRFLVRSNYKILELTADQADAIITNDINLVVNLN